MIKQVAAVGIPFPIVNDTEVSERSEQKNQMVSFRFEDVVDKANSGFKKGLSGLASALRGIRMTLIAATII